MSLAAVAGGNQWGGDNHNPTIIELFTSQGCSSCPPAEQWLSRLDHNPKLWTEFVPVAFHVDYWDGLGWKDQFSQSAYTYRQYQYLKEGAIRSVYTPGFVVNGQEWRGGNPFPEKPQPIGMLEAQLVDGKLSATLAPWPQVKGLLLNVAILGNDIRSKISAGENSGRQLVHDFTVLKYFPENSSEGNQWEIMMPDLEGLPGRRLGIAVWISKQDSIKPIQTIGGWIDY